VVTTTEVWKTYDVTSVQGVVGSAVPDADSDATAVVGEAVVTTAADATVVGTTVGGTEVGGSEAGADGVVTTWATTLADEDPAEEGAGPLDGPTPHCPSGLLPGNFGSTPSICSLIGHWILHEVLGSLSPPIKPGHLSIPLSPASQLSIICCNVVTSQPEIWYS
jgi:hypothetical protein